MVDHPPCTVRLVKGHEGTARFYTFEEFEALVAASIRISRLAHLIVLVDGEAGLRAGEMQALHCQTWTSHVGSSASSAASGAGT